jgi:hypothetical protein
MPTFKKSAGTQEKAGDTHSHGPLKGGLPTNQVVYNRLEFLRHLQKASAKPHTRREQAHRITIMLGMCAI